VTKETNVHVKIDLDGTGVADCSTGIHFLDHMLDVSTVYTFFFTVIMGLIVSAQTKYALW
jgi:imidazoleglycerol phosphate dehydratase HisB